VLDRRQRRRIRGGLRERPASQGCDDHEADADRAGVGCHLFPSLADTTETLG